MTRCHICGDTREDEAMALEVRDFSRGKSMPLGTYEQRIYYCADRPECKREARRHPFPKTLDRSRRRN